MRVGTVLLLSIAGLLGGSGCVAPHPVGGLAYPGGPAPGPVTGAPGCTDCGTERAEEPWRAYTIGARFHRMLTCGGGCGELYWGEWSYDPPPAKGCDRCDMDGHWIGPQPCGEDRCHHVGLKGIWGERYCPTCQGPCTGCAERAAGSAGATVPAIEPVAADRAAVPASRAAHEGASIQKEP